MVTFQFFFLLLGCLGTATSSRECREGFVKVKDWCFYFHLDAASMAESSSICDELGADMLTLDSEEKENAITKYIEDSNFFNMIQDRTDLQSSLNDLMATDEEAAKFCRDFKKFGMRSKSYKHIPHSKFPEGFRLEDRANLTTPQGFTVKLSEIPDAGLGAFTNVFVPRNTILGNYEGLIHTDDDRVDLYSWQVEKLGANGTYVIDASSTECSNWLRYINSARNIEEENTIAVSCEGMIFYMATRDITPGTEFLTWYGDGYGDFLHIDRIHPETDLPGTFLIRANVLTFDANENLYFDSGIKVGNHTNWGPDASKSSVNPSFGLLLSYDEDTGEWTWAPEKDYSYFTGPKGLTLPFICEDTSSKSKKPYYDQTPVLNEATCCGKS